MITLIGVAVIAVLLLNILAYSGNTTGDMMTSALPLPTCPECRRELAEDQWRLTSAVSMRNPEDRVWVWGINCADCGELFVPAF